MYNKVVYISGPYRADTIEQIEANITAAENEAIFWWRRGFAVLCPHKNTRDFEKVFGEDDVILPGDEELVSRCDIIVLLSTWTFSVGATREFRVAQGESLIILFKMSQKYYMLKDNAVLTLSPDIEVLPKNGKLIRQDDGKEVW